MPFSKDQLTEDEEVITQRSPHWTFMIGALAMVAGAVLITLAVAVIQFPLVWIGLIAILVSGIGAFGRYLRWRNTQLVLTNERIITSEGVLSNAGIEIPLDSVTNISFNQTFWQRLLRSGDLVVESGGEEGHQRFSRMANPVELQKLIYKQADIAERDVFAPGRVKGQPPAPQNDTSIPQQIDELAGLRKKNVISYEEFQEKKAELLKRM